MAAKQHSTKSNQRVSDEIREQILKKMNPVDTQSFPGGSVVKNPPAMQEAQEIWVDPWVGKIPWGMEWLPTPLFRPGEFHGQRNLVGYSPWGSQRVGHD